MPATMKTEKAQQYSMEIGNMIAEAFTRPEQGRFSGAMMYEQVFHEPDWQGMPDTRNRPRRLAGQDSVYQQQVGPIYGPINPNLLPFSMEFIGYPALSLLRQNIMLQNIVTVFSEEMTKKWVVPSPADDATSKEDVQQLIKLDQRWKAQSLFRKALTEQLFSGGCLVFVDVGDDNLEAPLNLDPVSIPKGSLKGFRIVEPMNCYAMGYNAYDPLAENYFVPQYWNIQGRDVHASRFLYFAENELPILLRPAYMFFGIPLTQLLLDYVYNFERSRDAAARALRNHSLLGLMTDLSSILQTGICAGNPQSIINRLKIMQATRDQDGIALLNRETEEFFQITTPLSGMMELTEQQLHTMSFAARIPVTKLFLTPPKGFSTTDEMSEQNWAQVVNGRQERQLTDNIEKFHKIIALNEWGKHLGTLDYTWPDVRDLSAKEKAELQNQLAQRDSALVGSQILDASEVRERMAADDESGYSGIYISDIDDDSEELIDKAVEHISEVPGLNGIQITALQGITKSVATGEIARESGKQLILASFPSISEERVEALLGGAENIQPAGSAGLAESGAPEGRGEIVAEVEKSDPDPDPDPKQPGTRKKAGDAAEFREEDHPRAANGQFGKGGSSSEGKATSISKAIAQVAKSIGISEKGVKTAYNLEKKYGTNGKMTQAVNKAMGRSSSSQKEVSTGKKEYKRKRITLGGEKVNIGIAAQKLFDTAEDTLEKAGIEQTPEAIASTFPKAFAKVRSVGGSSSNKQLGGLFKEYLAEKSLSSGEVKQGEQQAQTASEHLSEKMGTYSPRDFGTKDFAKGWPEHVKKQAAELSTTVPETLTTDEYFAVKTYTGESYAEINKSLRKGMENPDYADTIKDLDSAIEKTDPMPRDITVKRVFGSDISKTVSGMGDNEFFVDNGFVSTALTGNYTKSDDAVNIIIPKGSRGLFIPATKGEGTNEGGYYPHECEFLLPRGAGFKIQKRGPPLTLIYIGRMKREDK